MHVDFTHVYFRGLFRNRSLQIRRITFIFFFPLSRFLQPGAHYHSRDILKLIVGIFRDTRSENQNRMSKREYILFFKI